jgi:hypothetical protein
MDAHTTYPPNYIASCVDGLLQTGADSVGGTWVIVPTDPTIVGRAIALALSHPFGVGNSQYRFDPQEPIETDTVPFGSMWRRRMIEIGLYDEQFARSEDIEFNARLRGAGGRIMLLPSITSFYHARSRVWPFVLHNLSNGFWALYPIAFGPLPVRLRHVIPLCFILGLLLPALGSLVWPPLGVISLALAVAYILANLSVTFALSVQHRAPALLVTLPLAFASLHVPYGLGSAAGLGVGVWRRLRPSSHRRQPS